MKTDSRRRGIRIVALIAVACALGAAVAAQGKRYAARLSVTPLTVAMQETVAGRGSVTATLEGNRLVIEGTFEGFRTPATTAHVHMAPRAMRGPAIGELTVSRAERGTLKGAVELSDRERDALDRSSLYIQVNSEKAPDGNIWGWIFPQEVGR